MTYQVTEEERERVPAITVRVRTTMARIPEDLGSIYQQVFLYLQQTGTTPAAPPFARYHEMTDVDIDMEAGISISTEAPGNEQVRASELPAGPVASVWYIGPYGEGMAAAYNAIEQWMAENQRTPAGAPWEVYWTDPEEEPDPEKYRTEIVWPLNTA